MTEPRTVKRFRKRTVWFHWIHTLAFLTLLITGAVLFLPGLGASAAGGLTRFIHRVAVVLYVGAPIVYIIISPRMSFHFIKETLTWGREDMRWLTKAPDYYFGGDEEKMIPQGHINTGQKMLQLVVVVTAPMFVLTGIVLWFFKDAVSAGVFQWTLVVHDITFVIAFLILLVHVYLGVIHPRMTESLRSMIDGRISKKYAQSHYKKWYDSLAAPKE
ncbi:formate dehydrogenase subunit gamma [Chloroflexota bacterium]